MSIYQASTAHQFLCVKKINSYSIIIVYRLVEILNVGVIHYIHSPLIWILTWITVSKNIIKIYRIQHYLKLWLHFVFTNMFSIFSHPAPCILLLLTSCFRRICHYLIYREELNSWLRPNIEESPLICGFTSLSFHLTTIQN